MTKNALDIANYDAEFNQLQDQLANIREEKFNGINLFTSDSSAPSPLTTYSTETGDGVTKTTTAEVTKVTLGSSGAGDEFNISIDGTALGTAVGFNIDDATTAGDLKTAIEADATLNAMVTVVDNSDGSLSLTAKTTGQKLNVASPWQQMAVITQLLQKKSPPVSQQVLILPAIASLTVRQVVMVWLQQLAWT